MKNYENGTVYGKYKKIKDQSGVARAKNYISDKEKTQSNFASMEGALSGKEESDVKRAMAYIQNDLKTYNEKKYQHLVSGVNCTPAIAAEQFREDEEDYHRVKREQVLPGQTPNRAFHIILSYKGRDVVSPELCHKLGVEFAKRIAGDEYRAVVATHLNTDNVHNHILLCAYSLDKEHPHKYLDKLNQYKYFRRVANELSVEYGLPIFLDDKKTKTVSWGEMIKSEEGRYWIGQIKQDLSDLMDASTSFDEVLDGMRELGYQVTTNRESITYEKDIYSVRDRRLGREYTREGFEAAFEKVKKLKEQERIRKERDEMRKKRDETNGDSAPILIPRYDASGHRRGTLIRILLLIKALIERFGDSFLLAFEEADRPEMKSKDVKLKLIDDTLVTLRKYHIGSQEALDYTLRSLHQGRRELLIELSEKQDIVDNGENLRKDLDRFVELYSEVKKIGIDPKDLVINYDESRVNENRASLNPLRPATKSRLYKALYGSPYTLTRSFRELSEKEAREIISVIRDEKADGLPPTIKLGRKRSYKKEKETKKRNAYDLSQLSEEKREKVLDLKELLMTYGLYGITDAESALAFKKEYDACIESLEGVREKVTAFDRSIRELYKVKALCSKMVTSDFAYGVLFTGDRAALTNGVKEIKKDSYKGDYLRAVKKRLDSLDTTFFEKDGLPNPEEYRILRDLESVYPGILDGIKMDDPRDVDDAITALQVSGWLQDEISREDEKERTSENEQTARDLIDSVKKQYR